MISPPKNHVKKIHVVGNCSYDYANWMTGESFSLVQNVHQADFVVFTGGEDVSPAIYNEDKHPLTECNPDRDKREAESFGLALELGKPMVGICRGAQFLCVMAGGQLVQHQEPQPATHAMKTHDGQNIFVTSSHHQAQYPWSLEPHHYRVMGWTEGLSAFHEDGNEKEMINGIIHNQLEVEVAHYPIIKALAIQSHPEWTWTSVRTNDEARVTIKYFQRLLAAFLEESK